MGSAGWKPYHSRIDTAAGQWTMTRPEQTDLEDEHFIRHRLYGGDRSAWRRYADLVLARPTVWSIVRHELMTLFVIHLPGALGLAARKLLMPRLLGACGRGAVFGRSITWRHYENVKLGSGVLVDDYCLVDARGAGEHGIVLGDRVIVNRGACLQAKVGAIGIGDDCNIGGSSKIISQGPISIGRNVSIAGDVIIAGGRFVVEQGTEAGEKRRFTSGTISIGDHVRIGTRSIIQDGVSIGEGAIVAPGSVVVGDVPAFTVVSGNPARPWRERKPRDRQAADRAPETDAPRQGDQKIREQVRGYLAETHFASFGPGELSDDDSLFDNDIMDSVGVVALASWLEATFDIDADEDDLIPENLETVARIERFVGARRMAG
jgi:acetyltransferase-like isoleucine patch superfamily enzyme/acyl carrier protein